MFHISLLEFYTRKSNDISLFAYTAPKFVDDVEN